MKSKEIQWRIKTTFIFFSISTLCFSSGSEDIFQHSSHLVIKRDVCSADKFRCLNGDCIDKILLCDGAQDCVGGDDETVATCRNNKCSLDKFRCSTGACIDIKKICDGNQDCSIGGDDEKFVLCKNNKCSADKFRCSTGSCIDKLKLCDGNKDCPEKGEDESYSSCQYFTCPPEKYRCPTGACIDRLKLCDGVKHCVLGGEDESFATCQNNKCLENKFRCSTGACIDKSKLCDGVLDCVFLRDDEAPSLCKKDTCSGFKCSNGACIERNKICDGNKDCPRGEDESCQPETTSPTKPPAPTNPTKPTNPPTPTGPTCLLPPASPDKTFAVECPFSGSGCSYGAGSKVPVGTQVLFNCNAGYQYNGGSGFVSSCFKGMWEPPISKCHKTCPPIKAENVVQHCYQQLKGAPIICENPMPEGAVVYPMCKFPYHKETEVDYQYIRCLPNGQWDRQIFKCIPDCGKTQGNITGLVSGGKPETRGDSPWHVAIYDVSGNKPELICGGTIVTSLIIISAAHCFFNFQDTKLYGVNNYEVIVAKYTRDYATKDNTDTKKFRIKKIFIPNEIVEFTGDSTNFAGDIAILWISAKLTFSRGVLPACVDWTESSRFVLSNGARGKIVGWGETENREPSSVLRVAYIPYINYTSCRRLVSEDFANSIATDKFCAGDTKGSGARPGDSGGGLLFRDTKSDQGLYYLRGVVSNKDGHIGENETSIAAFTDVAQYIKWIYDKRIQIEDEVIRLEGAKGDEITFFIKN